MSKHGVIKHYGVVNMDDFYPLVNFCQYEDRNDIMAQWTGEFRPPKKGEWFLSGSIVEAYHAINCDLSTSYHIARLVRVEKIVTFIVKEVLNN